MLLISGEEPLDDSAPLVAAQPSAVLGLLGDAIRAVRRDHLGALFFRFGVELVTVVSAIADRILRSRVDHAEVECRLHQRDLVVIGGMRRDCGPVRATRHGSLRSRTTAESGGAPSCSSSRTAEARATRCRCWESTAPLRGHLEPESACGRGDRRDGAPPEGASGSVRTVRPICVARTDLTCSIRAPRF